MKCYPFGRSIVVGVGFVLVVLADRNAGADSAASPANYAGKPETGMPLTIPGTIRAVDYDEGGESVAFSSGNTPKQTEIRKGADSIGLAGFGRGHVSTAGAAEAPDQVYVGWTGPGEWLKYTVKVAEAGTYVIGAKVAAGSTGATLTFSFGPDVTTGEVEIPTTAGFQPGVEVYHVWETLDHLKEITLPAGICVMTVKIGATAGLNLESFTLTKKP
jgi:hypothetical protein